MIYVYSCCIYVCSFCHITCVLLDQICSNSTQNLSRLDLIKHMWCDKMNMKNIIYEILKSFQGSVESKSCKNNKVNRKLCVILFETMKRNWNIKKIKPRISKYKKNPAKYSLSHWLHENAFFVIIYDIYFFHFQIQTTFGSILRSVNVLNSRMAPSKT